MGGASSSDTFDSLANREDIKIALGENELRAYWNTQKAWSLGTTVAGAPAAGSPLVANKANFDAAYSILWSQDFVADPLDVAGRLAVLDTMKIGLGDDASSAILGTNIARESDRFTEIGRIVAKWQTPTYRDAFDSLLPTWRYTGAAIDTEFSNLLTAVLGQIATPKTNFITAIGEGGVEGRDLAPLGVSSGSTLETGAGGRADTGAATSVNAVISTLETGDGFGNTPPERFVYAGGSVGTSEAETTFTAFKDDYEEIVTGIIADLPAKLSTMFDSAIISSLTSLSQAGVKAKIDALVSSFESRQRGKLARGMNRLSGGFVDINATQGSAFLFAQSNLEAEMTQEVADYRAQLEMTLLKDYFPTFIQTFQSTLNSYMDQYFRDKAAYLTIYSGAANNYGKQYLSQLGEQVKLQLTQYASNMEARYRGLDVVADMGKFIGAFQKDTMESFLRQRFQQYAMERNNVEDTKVKATLGLLDTLFQSQKDRRDEYARYAAMTTDMLKFEQGVAYDHLDRKMKFNADRVNFLFELWNQNTNLIDANKVGGGSSSKALSREANQAIYGTAGAVGGAWAGLKIGAAVGSAGGPLGMAIGAGVGLIGGLVAGNNMG